MYGDGSLGYSVAEFDTFTRHKVKSLITIFTLYVCKHLSFPFKNGNTQVNIAHVKDVSIAASTYY